MSENVESVLRGFYGKSTIPPRAVIPEPRKLEYQPDAFDESVEYLQKKFPDLYEKVRRIQTGKFLPKDQARKCLSCDSMFVQAPGTRGDKMVCCARGCRATLRKRKYRQAR